MAGKLVELDTEDLDAISGGASTACAGGQHSWVDDWHSFIRADENQRQGRRVRCSRCGAEGYQFDDGAGWYNVSYDDYLREAK